MLPRPSSTCPINLNGSGGALGASTTTGTGGGGGGTMTQLLAPKASPCAPKARGRASRSSRSEPAGKLGLLCGAEAAGFTSVAWAAPMPAP